MTQRGGDPYWLRTKRLGTCSGCQQPIKVGQQAFWYPATRSLLCDAEPCGKKASRDFEAAKFDEQNYA
jgi:hypothetical protein